MTHISHGIKNQIKGHISFVHQTCESNSFADTLAKMGINRTEA
uniref:Uncharacterized protein n=1 Tax=Rhizophora mucronata TaxID=61149 RepID=A0A2P2QG19_RHIMU